MKYFLFFSLVLFSGCGASVRQNEVTPSYRYTQIQPILLQDTQEQYTSDLRLLDQAKFVVESGAAGVLEAHTMIVSDSFVFEDERLGIERINIDTFINEVPSSDAMRVIVTSSDKLFYSGVAGKDAVYILSQQDNVLALAKRFDHLLDPSKGMMLSNAVLSEYEVVVNVDPDIQKVWDDLQEYLPSQLIQSFSNQSNALVVNIPTDIQISHVYKDDELDQLVLQSIVDELGGYLDDSERLSY